MKKLLLLFSVSFIEIIFLLKFNFWKFCKKQKPKTVKNSLKNPFGLDRFCQADQSALANPFRTKEQVEYN